MTAIFKTINHCQKYQNSFVLGFSKPMAIFKLKFPAYKNEKLQKNVFRNFRDLEFSEIMY